MKRWSWVAIVIGCIFVVQVALSSVVSQNAESAFPPCVGELLASPPADAPAAIAALEARRNELRSAGQRRDEGYALLCLGRVTYAQGAINNQTPYLDARRHFERALLAFREVGDRGGEARAQHQFGRTYHAVRDFTNALPQYQQSLRIAQAATDSAAQADIYFDTARFYSDRAGAGELVFARDNYQLAANTYFQIGDERGQGESVYRLAEVHFALRDVTKAIDDFTTASFVFLRLGDTPLQAQATHGIARVLLNIGDLAAAEPRFEEARTLYQQAGDIVGEGRVLAALGNIYYQLGYPFAESMLDQALALHQTAGDNEGRALTLSYLGDVYLRGGNVARATASFTSALDLARAQNLISAQAYALHGRGRAAAERARLGQDQLRTALNDFGESIRLYRDVLNDRYNTRRVFLSQGLAWQATNPNNTAEYERWLFESLNIAREVGDKRGEIESLMVIAQSYQRRLDYDNAVRYYRDALTVAGLPEVSDSRLLGDINAVLGDVDLARRRFAEARALYNTALFNYETAGDVVGAASVSVKLAQTDLRLGSTDEALIGFRGAQQLLDGFDDPRVEARAVQRASAQASFGLGTVYAELGLFDRAVPQLTRALDELQATGDLDSQGLATVTLGDIALARGSYSDANARYQAALQIGRRAGNLRVQALATAGTGAYLAVSRRGTELQLQTTFDGALVLARQAADRDAERQIFLKLGDAALFQNNRPLAIEYYGSARAVAQEANDRRNVAFDTLRIAIVHQRDPGDVQGIRATNTFTTALEQFRAIGYAPGEARALEGLGVIAQQRGQFATAQQHFNGMRTAYEIVGDRVNAARASARIGEIDFLMRRANASLRAYNAALETLERSIDRDDELVSVELVDRTLGDLLRLRGTLYHSLQQYALANDDLAQAEAVLRGVPQTSVALSLTLSAQADVLLDQRAFVEAFEVFDRARDLAGDDDYARGVALYGIARVYAFNDDPTDTGEAQRTFNVALDIFRTKAINPVIARNVLLSTGDFYKQRGLFSDAQDWYFTAINEARTAGDPIGHGYALLELGTMRAERFRFSEAVADLTEAARQFQAGSDWAGRGEALYRIADIRLQQVNYPAALEQYQTALVLYETQGDSLREAETLTRIGEAYQRQEQLALALNQHFLALDRLEAFRAASRGEDVSALTVTTEARIQRNLGSTRLALGQFEQANRAVERALTLAREADDTEAIAATTQLLGRIAFIEGRYALANELYRDAAAAFARANLPARQGELLIDQGDALFQQAFDQGESFIVRVSEARIQYQRALDAARGATGNTVLEIRALQGLGKVFNWSGQTTEASENLVAALDKATVIDNPTLRASVLVDLGQIAERRNDQALAVRYYEEAIDLFEDVYVNIRLEPGQIAFASQNILPYHRLVDIAIQQGDPAAAFAYSERGRARSLLYQLGTERLDFGIDIGGDLLADWQRSREQVRSLRDQIALLDVRRAEAPNAQERERLREQTTLLRDQAVGAQAELNALLERIDTRSAVLSQVTRVNPRDLAQVQRTLDAGTRIVSYYIIPPSTANQGRVYAFVITDDSFNAVDLSIRPAELAQAIEEDVLLSRQQDSVRGSLVDLHAQLIAPLGLQTDRRTLVVVPHGVLNALPFSALTSDRVRFVGDTYNIAYASSATFYAILREERAPRLGDIVGSAVVFGNPASPEVGRSDPSLTRDVLQPLAKAEVEAQRVSDLLGVPARIQRQATESTLWQEAQRASLIHIAAHGVFNPQNPLTSFLALADDEDNDGALEVREIYSLSLRANQPLVVLSACDTSVGGSTASDDLQSLSRAFLISGARSVVATLWTVDDEATQVLMTRFYENIVIGRMTTAEALRDAQTFLRVNPERPEWAAPRYWAAFVLVGLPS